MKRQYDNYLYSDLTGKIIQCVNEAHKILGHGFLEKVYENALILTLLKAGLQAVQQAPVNVMFDGKIVGEYIADVLVENKIVLELKAVSELAIVHEVQLVNYLKSERFTSRSPY